MGVRHNPTDDKTWTFCDICGDDIAPGWPVYGTWATCERHDQCLECGHWINLDEEQLDENGICVLCSPVPFDELE